MDKDIMDSRLRPRRVYVIKYGQICEITVVEEVELAMCIRFFFLVAGCEPDMSYIFSIFFMVIFV